MLNLVWILLCLVSVWLWIVVRWGTDYNYNMSFFTRGQWKLLTNAAVLVTVYLTAIILGS